MSWPIAKLGELVEVQNGGAFKSSEYAESGHFLMRITNVQKGYISNNNPKYVSIQINSKLRQFILNEGDILMSLTGNVGRVGIVKGNNLPAALNQRVARLKINSKEIDKNYLFWFLNNDKTRIKIESCGYGAAQINVSSKQIELIEIPLPPIAEQQRIATILGKAEEIRQKRECASEMLNKLSKEVFSDMFAHLLERPNTSLGNAFDVRDGTHDSPKFQSEGYPLITSKNLNNNKINFENANFISSQDFEAINKRSKVEYCDILMPMIGTIGNPIVIYEKTPKFAIKNVALIKTGNLEASLYVKALLETKYFERYVAKESKGGTQKFLSLGNIRDFPIYMPSNEQLHKFAKISNNVIQTQKSLDNSRFKLHELLLSFQSSLLAND
ncbi:hypothetical protein B6A14_08415 [Polynucleobacter hirudinilacicola]|uniref:Type I restriction modification DNA specificity domain-containing protein n=1 Tax=Polynucleobacter hirudinilacicola TaxID=1743166 RepID=A0A210RXW6_9BURK|nr:restriction endonuclease subunit S [Polynucleobacter hirudinilacicola]OWF65780.1 hypothetical protein B6A14_08415 [Polynucleobacter hirudinilacicola]